MENRKHSNVICVFHSLFKFLVLVFLHPSNQQLTEAGQVIPNQISTDVQLYHDELNLGNRMSAIEAKNRYQEDEIALLKTLRAEDKIVINQLKNRVEQLEKTVANVDSNEKVLARPKRPFRLAPANFNR